jgi:hypothetical protein
MVARAELMAIAARTYWREDDGRAVVPAWRASGESRRQFARKRQPFPLGDLSPGLTTRQDPPLTARPVGVPTVLGFHFLENLALDEEPQHRAPERFGDGRRIVPCPGK